MASQVLSGSTNVGYTNNTGGNVRVIINYMSGTNIAVSWAGVSVSSTGLSAIGRNLAYTSASSTSANNSLTAETSGVAAALPTEIMLAATQTFSATGVSAYNIVVIPELG
jgi:hypothetical protein